MKKIILSFGLFIVSFATTAQVGIGTISPEGVLDVVSTNSGIILPRVANTAAVTSPKNGMIVYDLSFHCVRVFVNGVWSNCFGLNEDITVTASNVLLAQIGNEADDPDIINSGTTIADLNAILPTVTGIQSTKETSYQNYIDGNPALFSSPATQAEVQAMADAISATDVVGASGNIWMDRNLGATQVATSSTDAAAYGDLYQWGRGADGHASRTSGTTTTTSDGDVPGHGLFIIDNNNWRTTYENNLWQGVNGVNNPCPSGYRIPTKAELAGLGITNAATALSSPLKLTIAGYRRSDNGSISSLDTAGFYWSSEPYGPLANLVFFNGDLSISSTEYRAGGVSVRCIKE